MGEYAKYQGHRVKIGTCADLFYLRYEDRGKVTQEPNSLDPKTAPGLRFRLSYTDEDHLGPGNYPDYNRASRLWGFSLGDDEEFEPGTFQVSHPSGLLLNVPCYHGARLPDGGFIGVHWNGRDPSPFELSSIGERGGKVVPIIRCRHCESIWRVDWRDIADFIEPDLRSRLSIYIEDSGHD